MCNCKNIEVGSYQNQVELKAPKHLIKWAERVSFSLGGDRKTICIDRCIEQEIKHLWSLGITTVGCCCGHNNPELPYIQVVDEDIPRMKELGYSWNESLFVQRYAYSFKPKSIKERGLFETLGEIFMPTFQAGLAIDKTKTKVQ